MAGLINPLSQRLPSAVMRRQQVRCGLANMANAQSKKKTSQGRFYAALRWLERACLHFSPPTVTVFQLLDTVAEACAQRENFRWFPRPAVLIELFCLLGAEPVDVKRGARNKMLHFFNCLRGAYNATTTASDRIAFIAHSGRTAFRAMRGIGKTLGIRGTF